MNNLLRVTGCLINDIANSVDGKSLALTNGIKRHAAMTKQEMDEDDITDLRILQDLLLEMTSSMDMLEKQIDSTMCALTVKETHNFDHCAEAIRNVRRIKQVFKEMLDQIPDFQ